MVAVVLVMVAVVLVMVAVVLVMVAVVAAMVIVVLLIYFFSFSCMLILHLLLFRDFLSTLF